MDQECLTRIAFRTFRERSFLRREHTEDAVVLDENKLAFVALGQKPAHLMSISVPFLEQPIARCRSDQFRKVDGCRLGYRQACAGKPLDRFTMNGLYELALPFLLLGER